MASVAIRWTATSLQPRIRTFRDYVILEGNRQGRAGDVFRPFGIAVAQDESCRTYEVENVVTQENDDVIMLSYHTQHCDRCFLTLFVTTLIKEKNVPFLVSYFTCDMIFISWSNSCRDRLTDPYWYNIIRLFLLAVYEILF